MPSPIPQIDPEGTLTFAGISEGQIRAFFAEASVHFGVGLGYAPNASRFQSWESAPSKTGSSYICESAPTILAVVNAHKAQRPPSGLSRAAELRKKAADALAEAEKIEAEATPKA